MLLNQNRFIKNSFFSILGIRIISVSQMYFVSFVGSSFRNICSKGMRFFLAKP
eukprot:UN09669